MKYYGYINKKNIEAYQPLKLSRDIVHKQMDIDEILLKEKDSWYETNEKGIVFFKQRNDSRLFGEIISQKIMESLGEKTANYSIAYVHHKLGLLTPNFHNVNENKYYDMYNLHQLLPKMPRNYKGFTLKRILDSFEYSGLENYKELQQSMINRYIIDWITHQIDTNPRNIIFKENKKNHKLTIGPSIDREQSFGARRCEMCFDSSNLKVWIPAIPYEDVNFREKPYTLDGIDPNIFELAIDYPEMVENAFNHAFSINYNNIFNDFRSKKQQITLPEETCDYLSDIIKRKEDEKHKVLKLIKG